MKSRRNRFLPQAADSASVESRLPLAERSTRHLRWSAAISRAFRRADGLPRWPPASLTFGLRAKRMLSLMRPVLNVRLSWPRVEQSLSVTSHVLAQRAFDVRKGSSHTGLDSRSRTLRPPDMPLASRHSQVLQTLSRTERRSEHRFTVQGPAAARTLWLSPSAGSTSLGLRPNAITHDGSAPEITTRIARRLRRVENALPFSSEPRVVAGAAPIRGLDEIVGAPVRRSYRDASPVHRSELSGSAPTTPGINVTHLTDEVMRQIDRRLIALRERMGKI